MWPSVWETYFASNTDNNRSCVTSETFDEVIKTWEEDCNTLFQWIFDNQIKANKENSNMIYDGLWH